MDNLLPSGHTKLDITVAPFVPLIIGASIVLAAAIGSYAFYAVNSMNNVLSVTGSTKVAVTSDTVKWKISIVQTALASNLQAGYPLLAQDLETTTAFLKSNGIPADAITTSQVFTEEVYKYNQNDPGPREYSLRQEITVQSKDVQGIDVLSKRINELASKGVFIQWNNLEYYVSNLPELRVSLLGDAIKDARARAEQIAKAGGQNVGALKAASSGVVQVLSPNSVEVTDYGSYDTQSIEKEVMVTARATFFVR
ncbi:SIMPL domain-containing protein [Patescibacteria group bacterium]|nr:SIMPL domain-containing protein [Patescibacteria group bacterium]